MTTFTPAFRALIRTGLALCAAVAIGYSADKPDTGAHLGSQAAADALRDFASADGAFLAAGLVKEEFKKDDLASLLQYPTDEVVVLSLSGSQIRQALERSVSLHPQPNMSFLQISGFEVTFSQSAAPGSRIVSVSAGGSPLADTRTYTVAMPSSLGRGGLGYFKIWDKAKIVKTYEGATLESVLKGKRFTETSPRWSSQG